MFSLEFYGELFSNKTYSSSRFDVIYVVGVDESYNTFVFRFLLNELDHKKICLGFPTRYVTNRAVHSQKMA